jgi:hypothetical protein
VSAVARQPLRGIAASVVVMALALGFIAMFEFFMLGGWPFTAIAKQRLLAGLAVLVASCVITYGLFATFFDYAFLQGTPAYLASAPQGLFNGVIALVFYVTCLAVMPLWPASRCRCSMGRWRRSCPAGSPRARPDTTTKCGSPTRY